MKTRIIMGACLLVSMISISGCQTITAETCNNNSAYASGVNDAKNGADMNYDYAMMCPANKRAINTAYQQGYQFGLAASGPHIHVYAKRKYLTR